jgi:hypothetical protein
MDVSHVAAVFRNDRMNSSEWSNVIGEPMRVLSVTIREGEPKYVVVGRGTFVIFADEEGIWSIDLEAESWDSDVEEVFPLMKIEIW